MHRLRSHEQGVLDPVHDVAVPVLRHAPICSGVGWQGEEIDGDDDRHADPLHRVPQVRDRIGALRDRLRPP